MINICHLTPPRNKSISIYTGQYIETDFNVYIKSKSTSGHWFSTQPDVQKSLTCGIAKMDGIMHKSANPH